MEILLLEVWNYSLGATVQLNGPSVTQLKPFLVRAELKKGSKIMSYNHVFKAKVKSVDLEKAGVTKPF